MQRWWFWSSHIFSPYKLLIISYKKLCRTQPAEFLKTEHFFFKIRPEFLKIEFLTLINYSCAKSLIGCSGFAHMYAVWYMMKGSERVLIWYLIGCPSWCRRDQGTSDLDLQWDARWNHWSKHDTAYMQADYVLQCNIQLNLLWFLLLTRHTWWICYGVQGFVKVVSEWETKTGPNQKNLSWKMD